MRCSFICRSHPWLERKRMQADLKRNAAIQVARGKAGNSPVNVSLPRLPVPDPRASLERFLKSIEPFLLEDAARNRLSFEKSYARELATIRPSLTKRAPISHLQRLLVELDQNSPYNWLDDNIWPDKAYLERREPLLINSNWWLAFQNDSNVPEAVLTDRKGGITPWQLRRASWLVSRILQFKDRLEKQELYPESTRTGMWFQYAVSRMFNTCRVPHLQRDSLNTSSDNTSSARRKLVVMVHDWFYAVEVIDKDGRSVQVQEIERRLRRVIRDVETRLERSQKAVPIGLLSADNRDTWAKNLEHLLSLSPANSTILTTIQESLFALSLDHYTHTLLPVPPQPPSEKQPPPKNTPDPTDSIYAPFPSPRTPRSAEAVPESRPPDEELDAHLHNVRSGVGAHNRFFDKAFTLIVENNTRAGAMGEHSPVDALVPSIVCEYALVEGIDSKAFVRADPDTASLSDHDQGDGWERLDWVVDKTIEEACLRAEERAKAVIADSDDSVLWFDEYAADWIKDEAKLSPDGYIQMALQLAWYRTRGCFTAVYETALTRIFLHGRTETIRSFTTESRSFVLAMVNPSVSLPDRHKSLCHAVNAHVSLSRAAAAGRGIDRHFMGLEFVRRQFDPKPPLFDNPYYELSREWKLSTSGLSAGHLFRGTGFGAPYYDGYGINYLAGPDVIKFGVESKHSCPDTSTSKFKAAVVDALRDMKDVCMAGAGPTAWTVLSTTKL